MTKVMSMNEHLLFSTTSSSLFDTYLVYGVIGLLLLIAIIGLIVLLATSCCCYRCCFSSASSCFCCYHGRRHSSYKLSQRSKQLVKSEKNDSKKISFIRRHSSDVADFSQLYDSCPHLINSKAMNTTSTNMETSCTTIDTLITPISTCSSFRSFVQSGSLPKDTKTVITQNDLNNPLQQHINPEKSMNAPTSSAKGVCNRPFSYIKNTNDRAQILRRFTQCERSIPVPPVSLDITRISSIENDMNSQMNSNSANIYETVLPTTNIPMPSADISSPIYETEWTHSLRQIMIATASSMENEGVAVIELPSVSPPDLVTSTNQPADYFQQQQHPYGKFLAARSTTSESMRRANMLRRLKDDAAFLY